MSEKKLKRAHYEALTHMVSGGGKLCRVAGGFWISDFMATDFSAGDWTGASVTTLRQLESLGLIVFPVPLEQLLTTTASRRTLHNPEANITEKGLESVRTGLNPV